MLLGINPVVIVTKYTKILGPEKSIFFRQLHILGPEMPLFEATPVTIA